MSWMFPLEIAITIASIIQVSVYLYLYILYRERFMGIWAAGWTVDALINVFDLGAVLFPIARSKTFAFRRRALA